MSTTISLTAILSTIALYLGGTAYLIIFMIQRRSSNKHWLLVLTISALTLHAISIYHLLIAPEGIRLGFFKVGSLIFWAINLLILISGLKKPLHTLFIFLFPMSALALLMALITSEHTPITRIDTETLTHILLSLLAYSLMIIATLQALLLAYQNHQLKHKHPSGPVRLLPPLQTMESLFFELLWVGEIALTASIITGFLFLDNLFAQHLAHKTLLSMLAWCIYATLLWGRHQLGWRGSVAVRWSLGGFAALMLAYFGSKFALEILLGSH